MVNNISSSYVFTYSTAKQYCSHPRYSKDVYHRTWVPFFMKQWTQISTALNVKNDNDYVPPEDALKNAATPTNTSAPLTIEWTNIDNPNDQYYVYRHFVEIQDLRTNDIREFNMLWNGEVMSSVPVIPKKLEINTVYSQSPRICDSGKCSFQLVRTNRSTLPPLLNAFEVYTVIQFPQSETDESDGM